MLEWSVRQHQEMGTDVIDGKTCWGNSLEEAFSKMELENMEVIGKRPRCTGSRLVVYNQQTRGMSGRRTMAV